MAHDNDPIDLTDLEVISRFSLALRRSTASRADVVAALEADLTALTGGRRTASKVAAPAPAKAAPATVAPPAKTAAKAPAKKAAPAKKSARSRA
jgi:hypothetical protein